MKKPKTKQNRILAVCISILLLCQAAIPVYADMEAAPASSESDPLLETSAAGSETAGSEAVASEEQAEESADDKAPADDAADEGSAETADDGGKEAAEPGEERDEKEDVPADTAEDADGQEQTIHTLKYTAGDVTVTVESEDGFSGNTELRVDEIVPADEDYEKYLYKSVELTEKSAGLEYRKILNISLLKDGIETEPAGNVKVTIGLGRKLSNAEVVHFEGEKETPVLVDSSREGRDLVFTTDGFSAYAIVAGPDPETLGLTKVTDVSDLSSLGGLYMSHTAGYYFTNDVYNVPNTANRTGLLKTPLNSDPVSSADLFYFEPAGNGQYYIYTHTDSGIRYLKNSNTNSLQLSDGPETAFSVEIDNQGRVRIHSGKWYINMQGGAKGKGFACYDQANDANNLMYLWAFKSPDTDPYGLDGRTYGLMRYNNGNTGKAIRAEALDENSLEAVVMQVMRKATDHTDKVYVPAGSDISKWTFHRLENGLYNVETKCDGQTKYLHLSAEGASLSDTPQSISVLLNNGDRRIRLAASDISLCYGGNLEEGFTTSSSVTDDTWLWLVDDSEVTQEHVITYTAEKVSVSDTENVTNGKQVIVYTRYWNEAKKRYDLYAIDHDGTLIPCTDAGDCIKWVGGAVNTLLWDFTEYYHEGTTTPNYYYELQNAYSGMYLAPQKDGQTLSDSPIGINLGGRKHNDYFTDIIAWDDPHYSYAGLAVEDEELSAASISHASTFYFAVMQPVGEDDGLTTVNTLDNNEHGITMKMIDFSSKEVQDTFLGSSAGGANVPPTQGLLSDQLENGYPTTVNTNRSLSELYSGATDANHLFVSSIYNATGYYEFDSAQYFASLQNDGNFKVYEELGTTDNASRPSLKHGQFFPYDKITEGVFARINSENLYDAILNELPDSNPRKYEQMYLVQAPDYHFGMELEAGFVQPPSGLDNWGHDIIYEFTGDDDFWLYVDGELVIDLGGIHSALGGDVNFRTGQVTVNGVRKTLYGIFKSNYEKKHPSASAAETQAYLDDIFEENEDGQYIFKDYTSHTMKIFFMERGAGASNLHMKFNLFSAKPNQIILNKQISGTENPDYRLAEYGYQVYYQLEEDGPYYLLDSTDPQHGATVTYENTDTPVKYLPHYTPAGSSTTYENVFFLTPAQGVAITVPENTLRYKIVEVGVNSQVYDSVKVNDSIVEGTAADGIRRDYEAAPARVYERPRVLFDNHVSANAERDLTITKKLFDADGAPVDDDPTGFNFRLYLGTENEPNPSPANTQDYYVKDPSGNYCRWDSTEQRFISIGKTEYSQLTAADKESVTFQTSPNGAISKIPADYKVEVRGLLIGTNFRVEERNSEIPDGYEFIGYEREGDSYIIHGDSVNAGTIRDNESPSIDVKNKRGFQLNLKKVWSDAAYMQSHGDIWFALYAGGTLVPGSVKKLSGTDTSLEWYIEKLGSGYTLDDYEIKEVVLNDPVDDGAGNITYDTITPLPENGTNTVSGVTRAGETKSGLTYKVTYLKGDDPDTGNVRTDTVTNTRDGLKIIKTDMSGEPLANGVFTLTDANGDPVGAATYTSDAAGHVTTAYLEPGTYTLTETAAPHGYTSLDAPVSIDITDQGQTTVSGSALCSYDTETDTITVRNKPFSLAVVKIDAETAGPLSGVHFALHRQIMAIDGPRKDYTPISGYSDLVTDSRGIIPRISEQLPPGTYYIVEKDAPEGYSKTSDLCFTITPDGAVQVNTAQYAPRLEKTEDPDSVSYRITIPNYKAKIIPIPTGVDAAVKIILLLAVAMSSIALLRLSRKPGDSRKHGIR